MDLNESISETKQLLGHLNDFVQLTDSSNIPEEMKRQFKGVVDKEKQFLSSILQDDLNALWEQ